MQNLGKVLNSLTYFPKVKNEHFETGSVFFAPDTREKICSGFHNVYRRVKPWQKLLELACSGLHAPANDAAYNSTTSPILDFLAF